MEWLDGATYTGSFIDGKRHGEGCLQWANGRMYRGQWLRGLQHGSGVMMLKDGKEQRSEWRYGKAILESKGKALPKELPYTQAPELPGQVSPMPPVQMSASSANLRGLAFSDAGSSDSPSLACLMYEARRLF